MRAWQFIILFVASVQALQLQPAPLRPVAAAAPLRVPASPVCQFGGKPDTEPKGLSRDSEPEEFFATNMGALLLHIICASRFAASPYVCALVAHGCADDMSDAEKLKSPVVIGGVAILVLPFVIGMIALYASK